MPHNCCFSLARKGRTQFWRPVADKLACPATKVHVGWPGFGATPPDPDIGGIDNLVARVVGKIDRPTALIAQSMGGVIAVRAALEKHGLVTVGEFTFCR